jgi:hypothetical protein
LESSPATTSSIDGAGENFHIGREFIRCHIIHSLIKSQMVTKFDSAGIIVNPERVLLGAARKMAEVSSFLGINVVFL